HSLVLYLSSLPYSFSFFSSSAPHPALPSFPTRRSSDLLLVVGAPRERFARGLTRFLVPRLVLDEVLHRFHRARVAPLRETVRRADRKSTRLNSSHLGISYAVFCLKKKNKKNTQHTTNH